MLFNGRVELLAADRQSHMDGWGSWCAMCGRGLWGPMPPSVPRVPVSQVVIKRLLIAYLYALNVFPK